MFQMFLLLLCHLRGMSLKWHTDIYHIIQTYNINKNIRLLSFPKFGVDNVFSEISGKLSEQWCNEFSVS